jgi:hypothetical protein
MERNDEILPPNFRNHPGDVVVSVVGRCDAANADTDATTDADADAVAYASDGVCNLLRLVSML